MAQNGEEAIKNLSVPRYFERKRVAVYGKGHRRNQNNAQGRSIPRMKKEVKRERILVPTKGLEPSPAYTDCDLNAARLPFRHVGISNMPLNIHEKDCLSSLK